MRELSNHEDLRNPLENHENQENHRNPIENHENHENHRKPKRIIKIRKNK